MNQDTKTGINRKMKLVSDNSTVKMQI